MCLKTGRQCPGPLDGPLIIDMSSSAREPRKKRAKPDPYKTPSPPKFPDMLLSRTIAQIDQGAVINEAFYSNFLAYFTSEGEGRDIQNRLTWLHRLPDLSSDGTNNALTLALRATATAYCGAETGNPAVLQNAFKFYGEALQAHARMLRTRKENQKFTVHMVSTSVMLSLFEVMQATTSDAYHEHITGAVKMIEETGPGQCLQGVLCQLFFHIRTQLAFVYLTTRKTQTIPAKKILVESLSYKRLPIMQQLMSHIATLAEVYVNRKEKDDGEDLLHLSVYSYVKGEVDQLWLEYKEQAAAIGEELFTVQNGQTRYRDGYTALCTAYFSAARILLSLLSPRISSSYVDLTDHYAKVLDCAHFLRTKRIGCAYMRMATPLYLVALHSPCTSQRRQAISVFQEWQSGTMSGISALALGTIFAQDKTYALEGLQDRVINAGAWDQPDSVRGLETSFVLV